MVYWLYQCTSTSCLENQLRPITTKNIVPGYSTLNHTSTSTIFGWWFQTFFVFHNIWDNPSHWLSYFSRWLKPQTTVDIVCTLSKKSHYKLAKDGAVHRQAWQPRRISMPCGMLGPCRWWGPAFGDFSRDVATKEQSYFWDVVIIMR